MRGDPAEAEPQRTAAPMRAPGPMSRGRRIALLVYLLSPLLVLALLVALIFQAQRTGPKMNAPPVGAGAGETGMAKPFVDTRGKK